MVRDGSVQIVPAILAADITDYNRQLEQTVRFARRISLDFTDGDFAPTNTINLIQAHWPEEVTADLHLMYQNPSEHLETAISLKPHLVVFHAEAHGDHVNFIKSLQEIGIKAGVALLAETMPASHAGLIKLADHVMIFGGKLGSYGGQFNPDLLTKAPLIRAIKPQVEISWDGGVTHENIGQIAATGVTVINSGGYIQNADDPQTAYDRLRQIANSSLA